MASALDVWLGECPRPWTCGWGSALGNIAFASRVAMPDVTDTNGAAVPDQKRPLKPKRGKPKDEHAPPRPKMAFQQFATTERVRLKKERPDLINDIIGMGKELAELWRKVPEEEKARMTAMQEKEMEIWYPKWAAYKETPLYKQFSEVKQD